MGCDKYMYFKYYFNLCLHFQWHHEESIYLLFIKNRFFYFCCDLFAQLVWIGLFNSRINSLQVADCNILKTVLVKMCSGNARKQYLMIPDNSPFNGTGTVDHLQKLWCQSNDSGCHESWVRTYGSVAEAPHCMQKIQGSNPSISKDEAVGE